MWFWIGPHAEYDGIIGVSSAPVRQLTVRLDAGVVAWLQREGEGYQSRLNELLRKAMQDEICR